MTTLVLLDSPLAGDPEFEHAFAFESFLEESAILEFSPNFISIKVFCEAALSWKLRYTLQKEARF